MAGKLHDSDLEELKADIDRLRKQIVDSFAEIKTLSKTQRSVSDTEDRQRPVGAESQTTGSEPEVGDIHKIFDTARTAGGKALDEIIDQTTRHPLTGLFVAFGLGVVAARLFAGGRQK